MNESQRRKLLRWLEECGVGDIQRRHDGTFVYYLSPRAVRGIVICEESTEALAGRYYNTPLKEADLSEVEELVLHEWDRLGR